MEECEIIDLKQQIDPKTKKPMKKKPLFVKSNAVVVARVQVRINNVDLFIIKNKTLHESEAYFCGEQCSRRGKGAG